MKLHYYPETDSLYIELRTEAGAETREVARGVNVDFGADGMIVGLDIEGRAGWTSLLSKRSKCHSRRSRPRSSRRIW